MISPGHCAVSDVHSCRMAGRGQVQAGAVAGTRRAHVKDTCFTGDSAHGIRFVCSLWEEADAEPATEWERVTGPGKAGSGVCEDGSLLVDLPGKLELCCVT